jgi:hypothetical protein
LRAAEVCDLRWEQIDSCAACSPHQARDACHASANWQRDASTPQASTR